jgi:hypothetical protein
MEDTTCIKHNSNIQEYPRLFIASKCFRYFDLMCPVHLARNAKVSDALGNHFAFPPSIVASTHNCTFARPHLVYPFQHNRSLSQPQITIKSIYCLQSGQNRANSCSARGTLSTGPGPEEGMIVKSFHVTSLANSTSGRRRHQGPCPGLQFRLQ